MVTPKEIVVPRYRQDYTGAVQIGAAEANRYNINSMGVCCVIQKNLLFVENTKKRVHKSIVVPVTG